MRMTPYEITPIKVVSTSFDGNGSRLISRFLDKTSERFLERLLHFSESKFNEGFDGHAFWHGERQVKGQLAAALDKVCEGYFLQEPPVTRSSERENAPSNEENHGWCDFWCRYGKNKKIDVLIEVKHSWARYWVDKPIVDNRIVPYVGTIARHGSAISQIKSIRKKEYINDHLFAAALSVLPIFTRHKEKNCKDKDHPDEMPSGELKVNLCAVLKKFNAHYGYAISLPSKFGFVPTLDDPELCESYPAVMLVWSLKKVHRDRC